MATKLCIKCGIEFTKRPKASVAQWQTIKYCSVNCAGLSKKPRLTLICLFCKKTVVQPMKVTQSKFMERKYCSLSCRSKARTGDKAAHWKGDGITYGGIHSFMAKNYGKASKCENKDCPKKSTTYQWANLSGEYKHDRSDWAEMCASCHQLMDRKNLCGRGHELTPENSYIHPKRQRRHCRTCMKLRDATYRERKRLLLLPS